MVQGALKNLPLLILIILAGIHSFIAYSEIFNWEASAVEKIGMTLEDARASAKVGRNQGLYNGFLAAGVIWTIMELSSRGPSVGRPLATFFATSVLVAGLFGWFTFRKQGFLTKQALWGALALVSSWLPLWLGLD